ncbi:histidine kinase [Corynebacterium coyleae]
MCALGVVSSPQALSFALLVGALVVPFTRWRWPLATVVGIAAALVVASFSEVLPIGVIALGPFAAYVTRRHLPVPLRDVATAGLLVGDIVAIGFVVPALRELEPTDRIPYVVWSVTLLTVALLFGELRRRADESAEQELARQRAEFERAAQEQRAHLAREIHDIVTHSLTVIVAQPALYDNGIDTEYTHSIGIQKGHI